MEATTAAENITINNPANPTVAESLFAELLACEPGPTIDELERLFTISIPGLPNKTVFAAIAGHPDFNLQQLTIDPFDKNCILETWEHIPIEQIETKQVLRLIERLHRDPTCKDICYALGVRLLELATNLDKVILYVPELAEVAWTKMLELEEEDALLPICVHYFKGSNRNEKVRWILHNKPALASHFVGFEDSAIADSAAKIVLDSTLPVSLEALSRIVYNGEQQRVNQITAQRAVQRMLDEFSSLSLDNLMIIIRSASSATQEQKERAADLLLDREPDAILFQIIDYVPTRAQAANQKLDQLHRTRAEQQAVQPRKTKVLSQLLNLV